MSVNGSNAGAGYDYSLSISLSSPVSGSMSALIWCTGAEQVIRGKVPLGVATVEGDKDYSLTFKLRKRLQLREGSMMSSTVNFTYLCGRGTVTKDGKTTRLGYEDTVNTWLPYLTSKDSAQREAAAQALGVLTKQEDVGRVVPRLIQALGDDAFEVRRDVAEALGRIGDAQAVQPLTARTDATVEKDEWVRNVADEALKAIKKKATKK